MGALTKYMPVLILIIAAIVVYGAYNTYWKKDAASTLATGA